MLGRGTAAAAAAAAEGDPDCTEVLEDNSRSILMGIISQLRKDMDLHKVTLPTFVLEPRSMLERVTDFMSHPELLIEYVKTTTQTRLLLTSSVIKIKKSLTIPT